MPRIVALRIAVSLRDGLKRVASLVLSIIIFPKFTEGRLPSQSPHGTLFSFGPAETILAGAADNRALSRAAA
jgi:hypothetical protein